MVQIIDTTNFIPIYNNNDRYYINKNGELISLHYKGSKTSKYLKPFSRGKTGYMAYRLMINGKFKTISVHKLLWETFVGKVPENMELDHINKDRADNRLENLRLVTRSQNQRNKTNNYWVKVWYNNEEYIDLLINVCERFGFKYENVCSRTEFYKYRKIPLYNTCYVQRLKNNEVIVYG